MVRSKGWLIREHRLVREYEFSNLPPPETETYFRIQISLSRHLNGAISTNLTFCLRPYLYLTPDGLPFNDNLESAPFSVSLLAPGGKGTQDDPTFRGGIFETAASAYDDEPGTAHLYVNSNRATVPWINAMATGEELVFAILDTETGNTKLALRLPNDLEFRKLYEKLPAV